MAATARRELVRAVNAEINGLIADPPVEKIDFSTEYILEVDSQYPRELHDRENDYPLPPEVMKIKTEMLSDNHLQFRPKYYCAAITCSRKLECSLLLKKSMSFTAKTSNYT